MDRNRSWVYTGMVRMLDVIMQWYCKYNRSRSGLNLWFCCSFVNIMQLLINHCTQAFITSPNGGRNFKLYEYIYYFIMFVCKCMKYKYGNARCTCSCYNQEIFYQTFNLLLLRDCQPHKDEIIREPKEGIKI